MVLRQLLLATVFAALSACVADSAPVTSAGKPRAPGATEPAASPGTFEQLPVWLQTQIRSIAREPVSNPPASVLRYLIDGKTYYLRPARCCDIQSELYDADGNEVCRPDGGLTGRGDGRCPWFRDRAGTPVVVWRDKRARRMQSGKNAPGEGE